MRDLLATAQFLSCDCDIGASGCVGDNADLSATSQAGDVVWQCRE